MTTGPVEEQVSSWLDDELPAAELELLIGRMTRTGRDGEHHRHTAARYALIGEIMRGAGTESVQTLALHDRVQRALDDAAPAADPHSRRAGNQAGRLWWSAAAAAGLVAVTVGLLNSPRQSGLPAADVMVQQSTGPSADTSIAPASVPALARPAPVSAVAAGPQTASMALPGQARRSLSPDRLTNYLVYHGEYSGPISTKVVDSHIINQRPYIITLNAVERMAHD